MTKLSKHDQLRIYSQACAYIAVQSGAGDHSIGTAFHIGEGYFATARHVVEGQTILEIGPHTDGYLRESELRIPVDCSRSTMDLGDEVFPYHQLKHSAVSVIGEPHYHPDPNIDVALLRLEGIDPNTPVIELPAFLDDAVGGHDFLLTDAIVFGYPPVAFSLGPNLVVTTAEVNAVVDTRLDRYIRFIVSTLPRGGFSGGPAYHQYGFALGLVTERLDRQGVENDTGFMAVLSSDLIRDCMEHYGILPAAQRVDT
jgi:hypothetical protein